MKRSVSALFAVTILAAAGGASAATLTPVSYVFDQATDCGTYCYHDAGAYTPSGSPVPSTPAGELTDGELGYAGWAVGGAGPWVGWTDAQVNIDFTFDATYAFSSVSVGTTQDTVTDVVLPDLRVYSSLNGVDWTLRGTLLTPPSSANNNSSTSTAAHTFLTLDNLAFAAPYVRLTVNNHPGYGSFSFLDEVRFDGQAVGGVPEPGAWALMILGFGLAGASLRRRWRGAAAA